MVDLEQNSEVNFNQDQTGPQKKSIGPTIGLIIILLLIILGSLYFFKNGNGDKELKNAQNENDTAGSNEISDIEADLNITNSRDTENSIDSAESDMNQI